MPLEPRTSWFSPKCVEAQQLTGHLEVKHCFDARCASGTKLRQTLNTRYDPNRGQGRPVKRWGISFIVKRKNINGTTPGFVMAVY
ncbi:hypothetical protein PVAP13_6KG030200 [Panicum virgatum]|uniref:Uncharacterized protein n=1 Tax=Panicum virgatum TaxID=38727 RepID=A0A8T0R8Y9_PANVG|nr:hypothetical protein PVAP13_6KG030200 [Panicum virgatum]